MGCDASSFRVVADVSKDLYFFMDHLIAEDEVTTILANDWNHSTSQT
jgi:hypothetical protein